MLITNFGTMLSSGKGLWLEGWEYGKEITIPASSIDAPLVDFPLSVYLNESNFDFSQCKPDGSDIRFTDSELNPLKFERKEHNASYAGTQCPMYISGINRSIANNIFYSADDATTGSGSPAMAIDFSGISVETLEIEFDCKWYNSQPSIVQFNKTGALGVTWSSANLGISSGVTQYATENLYTTWGNLASGEKLGVTRTYSYAGGKTDLVYHIMISSYQYSGGYFRIKSLKVNGKNIAFGGIDNTTSASVPSNDIIGGNAIYNALIPSVSNTKDTKFYMWHGNPNAYNASIESWQDMTGKLIVYNGNAKLVHGVEGGKRVASFDGVGDYFSTPANDGFNFGTGDFCIETVVVPQAQQQYMAILGNATSGVGAGGFWLEIGTVRAPNFLVSGALYSLGTTIRTLASGVVYNIKLCRLNGVLYLYVNGVLYGSVACAVNITSTNALVIGAAANTKEATTFIQGSMHGMRITKGRSRSAENPPTSFDIDGPDVVFCTNFDTIYDNNYVMVQHMGDSLVDATGNGGNGTPTGTTVVNDEYGKSRNFNGTSDTISFPANSLPSGNFMTFTAFIKGGASLGAGKTTCFIEAKSATGNASRTLNIHFPWSDQIIYFDSGNGSAYDRISKLASAAEYKGSWQKWDFVKDVSTGIMKIYLNDVLWHSGSGLTKVIAQTNYLKIGSGIADASGTTAANYWAGVSNEIRASNIIRSDAWRKAERLGLKNALIAITDL